jgi:hypothetical protein
MRININYKIKNDPENDPAIYNKVFIIPKYTKELEKKIFLAFQNQDCEIVEIATFTHYSKVGENLRFLENYKIKFEIKN